MRSSGDSGGDAAAAEAARSPLRRIKGRMGGRAAKPAGGSTPTARRFGAEAPERPPAVEPAPPQRGEPPFDSWALEPSEAAAPTRSRKTTSLARKLTLLIACSAAGLVIFVACVFVMAQISSARDDLAEKSQLLTRLVAAEIAADLGAGRIAPIEATLARFAAMPEIDALAVVDASGAPIAASSAGRSLLGAEAGERGFSLEGDLMFASQEVLAGGTRVGGVRLRAGADVFWTRLTRSAALTGFVVAIAIGVAFLLGDRLQRVVTEPLLALVGVAERVREDAALHLRAEGEGDDEVGRLVASFNAMLDRLRDRDRQLSAQRDHLEETVQARTLDLSAAVEQARAAETEAKAARDAAEAASEAKTRFLANVSHEIRTPMNAVLGMSELLSDTALADRQRHMVKTIRSSGEALLALINDILDLSKIEAGKLELHKIDFDLKSLVEDTVSLIAERAHAKGLELACYTPEAAPRWVSGDPTRLRQVLINLLGNAIKFTDQGDVTLSLAVAGAGEERVKIVFEVKDTGVGIPLEKQGRVFDSFVQVDDSNTRKHGGTGLGLAISKTLVEMMEGEIGLESEPGLGSVFRFTAMFGRPTAHHADEDELPGPLPERALIVDDNAANREILSHHLRAWAVRVTASASGEEALERAREAARNGEPFDVAILDGQMPGMDGFELAERLAADPETPPTPIVLLTSIDHDAAAERRLEGQVRHWLTKPVRTSELRAALIGGEGLGAARGAEPGAADDGPLDLDVLVAEDNPVNQDVVAGMLESLGCRATVVDHGGEALEALRAGAFDMVLMDCHMPVVDGYEASRRIRAVEAEEGRARTPVLALTANAMAGSKAACLEAGMDDFLSKPFRREALRQLLASWRRPAERWAASDSPAGLEAEVADAMTALAAAPSAEPVSLLAEEETVEAADQRERGERRDGPRRIRAVRFSRRNERRGRDDDRRVFGRRLDVRSLAADDELESASGPDPAAAGRPIYRVGLDTPPGYQPPPAIAPARSRAGPAISIRKQPSPPGPVSILRKPDVARPAPEWAPAIEPEPATALSRAPMPEPGPAFVSTLDPASVAVEVAAAASFGAAAATAVASSLDHGAQPAAAAPEEEEPMPDFDDAPAVAPAAKADLDRAALDAIRQMETQGVSGIFERVVGKFRTMSVALVDQLRAAAAADDRDALANAAHSLKSSSANLGAARLADLARGLEEAARSGRDDTPWRAVVAEIEREREAVDRALRDQLGELV